MAETLPMLEHDPRARYQASRRLRVVVFAFVASVVLVSLLIVTVRFLYDRLVAEPMHRAPYNSNPLIVGLAMLVITAFMSKLLWDEAEMRVARRRK